MNRNSRFLITLLLIACFLAGFMLNLVIDGGRMPHKELVGILVTPFQTVSAWIGNGVTRVTDTFVNYRKLEEENAELRARVSELEQELSEVAYYQIENERLSQLLQIKKVYPDFTYASAHVVSFSYDGWTSSMTINQGSLAGIEKNNVVITPDGLVGIVREVGLYWATVATMLDPQISIGAMITSTRDFALTEGTLALKSQGLCRLSYIDTNVSISRGDRVETSGLGGVYPAGLEIGTIRSLETADNGLTQYAVLEPAVDYSELKQVFVILNFDGDAS